MSNTGLKEFREQLSAEQIINILSKLNVNVVKETSNYIIFPTACHNAVGGSPKLYYYKSSHLFKCYTECDSAFDIFELIIKIHKARGMDCSLSRAIQICGFSTYAIFEPTRANLTADVNKLYNVLRTSVHMAELPPIDEQILERYIIDREALSIWEREGISWETMQKFNIKYDSVQNCIIIPNYDHNNNLISVRGRFLDETAEAKYKPIVYGGKVLSHPSSLSLYGLNITKNAIAKHKKVYVFESEKSVMMMDTCYGEDNCAVATLGKNISMQQIRLLMSLGIRELILCYDRDYYDYQTMDRKRREYIKIAKRLTAFFNVAVLIDLDCNLLPYKASPIDCGKDIFEQILKNRIYV